MNRRDFLRLSALGMASLWGSSLFMGMATAQEKINTKVGVIGAMADKVLVMKDGKMVEYGETRQVLERPRELYTQKLMAAVPRLRR